MKHLYVLSPIYGFVNYSFEVDTIITDSKENDVSVLLCDGSVGRCSYNTLGIGLLCKECNNRSLAVLSSLCNVTILKMSDYLERNPQYPSFDYSSMKELKRVSYKGVEIGYGVASYYISLTRNMTPKVTTILKYFLDAWLLSSMRSVDIAKKLVTNEYDSIYVVNGRYFDSKPYQEMAFQRGIHITLGESMIDLEGKNVRMNFDNIKVHSIAGNAIAINKFWDASKVSLEDRKKIAALFYERRASAIATNDKVYVKGQKRGLLPPDWDSSKTNVVIFNSSQDEIASIGDEYETNLLFETQMSSVEFMLKNTPGASIHFYFRIHPNLMHVKYKYHTQLYNLGIKYSNITIIPGDSPISSYSILYASDRVVTFGSTMGLEAAYAGKPAMVLFPCLYTYLNVNYVPQSRQDVIDFVNGSIEFQPSHESILKFSYYYYNNEREGAINKECELKKKIIRLFGRKFPTCYMNLKCSNRRMVYCSYLNIFGIALTKLLLPKGEE